MLSIGLGHYLLLAAIIFTIGDNDTFALWYAQEIENYRTDVRTINTSLLATDWYMDQMKRKAYKSNPIKSTLEHSQYAYGVRDYIKFENIIDSTRWDLKDFISWISSDNERTKYKFLLRPQNPRIPPCRRRRARVHGPRLLPLSEARC